MPGLELREVSGDQQTRNYRVAKMPLTIAGYSRNKPENVFEMEIDENSCAVVKTIQSEERESSCDHDKKYQTFPEPSRFFFIADFPTHFISTSIIPTYAAVRVAR